ncbi:9929_t:CDS:2 [Funneliformis geosporum]|nr:9929_t:CDS:2 [Funneliformis geosporum]
MVMELSEKNTENLGSWNKKDFLALKNTLNKFITHIRFFEISSNDFHSKIWPFKKVLPRALFEDIVSFHMSNTESKQYKLFPRYKKIPNDSMIIKPKHAVVLTNWIQRKDANARIPRDKKYNYDLIYRGSRDGHDINTIRSMCNGQGACVLIIRTKENKTIIGGYNPFGWNYNQNQGYRNDDYDGYYEEYEYNDYDGNGYYLDQNDYWHNTSASFIFSLGDGNDLNNFKISQVMYSNYAIYESNYQNLPLNFGNSDLVINENAGTCNQAQYESKILDTNSFTIEEMEIFRFYQN